jgi:hypothetical protein
MAIDKSGKWWKGSEASDLDQYLSAHTRKGYPANRFVHARCECGRDRFRLDVDDEEGCAASTCTSCGRERLMLDSVDQWADADPASCRCRCGGKEYELAVGFAHRDDGTIKWVTVGGRCTACGLLGAFADWKIDYGPADHLYAAV